MRRFFMATLAFLVSVSAFAGQGEIRRNSRAIPGSYIVVLEDHVSDVRGAARSIAAANRGDVGYIYESALRGFSIRVPEQAIEGIARDPYVAYVEEDGEVSIETTQSGAVWGLDRSDQRNRPLSGTFTYTSTGSGVRAYIIDTGLRTTHTEISGRASNSYEAFGGNGSDCNGHGTHVAGTVGGKTYGIAKGVMLRGVRVLDCNGSGSWSGVIAGIDWVRINHVKPAVANMSLGGGASSSVDTAVNNLINAGVTVVVAAGNSNANACNSSPARVANAVTVGSTTSSDARSSFSNYGSCLDIFAPGSSIKSAWYTGDTATNTISGTSMASPHVAGVAAQYLSRYGHQSPATVRNAIVNNATVNVLTSIGSGSPNRLLFTNY